MKFGVKMRKSYHINSQFLKQLMSFESRAIGREYSRKQESDIVEVSDTNLGLRVVVAAPVDAFNSVYVEYHFRHRIGYRFLDEGDLMRYWESEQFSRGHHLFEITRGGWLSGEAVDDGFLSVALGHREWFVVTTNGCMNVISNEEPTIKEISEH